MNLGRTAAAALSRPFLAPSLPEKLSDVTEDSWPLVLPFIHFLYLIDSSMPKSFFASAGAASAPSTNSAAASKAASGAGGGAGPLLHSLGWQIMDDSRQALASATATRDLLRSAEPGRTIINFDYFERVCCFCLPSCSRLVLHTICIF